MYTFWKEKTPYIQHRWSSFCHIWKWYDKYVAIRLVSHAPNREKGSAAFKIKSFFSTYRVVQAVEEGNQHISSISKSGVLCSSGEAESFPRAWCFPLEVIFLCFASLLRLCVFREAGLRRGASERQAPGSSNLQERVEWSGMLTVVLPVCFREQSYFPFCCREKQWPSQHFLFRDYSSGLTLQQTSSFFWYSPPRSFFPEKFQLKPVYNFPFLK